VTTNHPTPKGQTMTDETTCEECGLTFTYPLHLHECRHKGRQERPTTTWAEECIAKVMT